MSQPMIVILATVALIVLSAFFVVIEFALLAARRHRLEVDAEHSRSARAALRGMRELTLMLAVAQLGITGCTFALGAVTKPALDSALVPVFTEWGIPPWLADAAAFGIALLFVTFLHLVIGEMMPKSWAIAHPELAAKLIGLPSRALAWLLRPLLIWINSLANRLVAASGFKPAERQAIGGQDADTIRHLVEHSAAVGVLDDAYRARLSQVLELERLLVEDLLPENERPITAVGIDATVADVRTVSADTGHLRVLVEGGRVPGIVHVRDLLLEPAEQVIDGLTRAPLELDASMPVYEALTRMREEGEQFVIVTRAGAFAGVMTVADIVRRILPTGTRGEM